MMTPEKKESFAFYARSLADLATASRTPLTESIANAMRAVILPDLIADFPTVGETLKAFQEQTKQDLARTLAKSGPEMWKELHTRTKKPVHDAAAELLWLNKDFPSGLPAGCECRPFYFRFLRENPPDFADYFAWTVKLHNAVNRKLNKPELSLEAARAIWSKS